MALIALVIKRYNELFKEEIFNFSDEFKVDFNFETNELKIDKNPDYIKNFYGESIYNISPIVGINGIGKTTVLNIISGYSPAKREQDSDNQYFFLFEIGKQEDKVRFKVSSNNLSIATLQECWGQTFYRNQDGSFDCEPEYYDDTKNILYVNLPSKGKGGAIESRTTLNQEGLAMFIHSYLWLSDRKIISSVLSCSLDISPYGLKDYTDSIPRGIKAIGFLIYKSIHNIFYEEDKNFEKRLNDLINLGLNEFRKNDMEEFNDNVLITHKEYKRIELQILLDSKVPKGTWRAGYANTEKDICLFITNDKSHIMQENLKYDNSLHSDEIIQWISQPKTYHSSSVGQMFIRHREKKMKVHIFARKYAFMNGNKTNPFIYLGQADYYKSFGDKPMTILWKLHRKLPQELIQELYKL